jgi:hypothetical protein
MSEEATKLFSLRLTGDGINIEQQIDQRIALLVVQVVMGAAPPVSAAVPGASVHAHQSEEISLSLREYLDRSVASKKPHQITTIGHYISEYEGQGDFGRDDVRSRFSTAREPLPRNFSRDFGLALKNGWIAEVHGKKNRFYVTAKGVQAIESQFSKGKGAVSRRKGK